MHPPTKEVYPHAEGRYGGYDAAHTVDSKNCGKDERAVRDDEGAWSDEYCIHNCKVHVTMKYT